MRRTRAYIPLRERYAAALACLLPQIVRNELRERKAPASAVISLFELDHIVLHAHSGADVWHNLTPLLKAQHREKSRGDTSIVAKGRRLEARWSELADAMRKGRKPPKKASRWPKRKMR